MITRLFFIGQDRIDDAVQTLKYDHMITDIGHTKIYYGPIDENLDWILPLLQEKGIDTSTFSVHNDAELRNKLPKHLVKNFYTYGGWVSQQIIKLLAIDSCEDEFILVQDCDTYLLKPHIFFNRFSDPVPMVIKNQTQHPHYYIFIEKILNIKRQTKDSFVTEFMPITKKVWTSMVHHIEHLHGEHWIKAIFNIFEEMADIHSPLEKGLPRMTMFSEYELLGNWQLHQYQKLELTNQLRFHSNKVDLSVHERYNVYCIKPDDTWKIYE